MWKGNIEKQTLKNRNYRKVIFTTPQMQGVLMYLGPGEEIGVERHKNATQFVRIEGGRGSLVLGSKKKKTKRLREGDAFDILPGKWHNIKASPDEPLLLYTIYSPPQHHKGTIQRFKPMDDG